MKGNKGFLIIGGILLAGAAGYGIYYAIKSGKKDDAEGTGGANFDALVLDAANTGGGTPAQLPAPQTTAQEAYAKLPLGSFPIKNGSKSKFAWILQGYLNCRFKSGLAVDGNFGSKSEAALLKAYGVKSISSQEHLKQLAYTAGHSSGTCESIALQKFANAIAASHVTTTHNFLNFLANG